MTDRPTDYADLDDEALLAEAHREMTDAEVALGRAEAVAHLHEHDAEPRRLDRPQALEDEREQLARQRGQNRDAIQGLARQGVQVTGEGFMALRMELLLDELLGPEATSERRLRWELNYERLVAERLENVGEQVARAKLVHGVPGGANGSPLL